MTRKHSLGAILSMALTVSLIASPNIAFARKARSDIATANAAALQRPKDATLNGALHEFAYRAGSLYSVQTSPQRITDIALETGEALLSVSAGDTARWVVGDAKSGSGRFVQIHVLIKPNAPGLSTNLVIMTDRRVYHVELRSAAGPSMAAVSWRYDDDLLVRGIGATTDRKPEEVVAGVPADQLNFKYKISGDKPAWRPLRAFDDGRRVFIQMPENIATTDAPPLFVMGETGPQLVNYRVRGQFYVVDRLFDRAELRIGDKRQRVVRIDRRGKLSNKGADNG